MNINLGLSEYGRMKFMLVMADQLHQIRALECKKANAVDNKNEYDMKIKIVQDDIMRNLKRLEKYATKNKTTAVCAFAQF